MGLFDKKKFLTFILENNVVGFFDAPITLKSGRKSNWYVNWRTVASDVFLTDKLADFLLDFVADLKIHYDGFFGVPEGATKLAVISSYKWATKQPNFDAGSHALIMGRGQPKEHGAPKDRFFVGPPRGKVVVLEDVTTTGQSLIEAIKRAKEAGAAVIAAVSLTDRMELDNNKKSVADAVEGKGVKYYAMSEAIDILPEAVKRFRPSAELVKAIEKEFEEFGVKPLRLK